MPVMAHYSLFFCSLRPLGHSLPHGNCLPAGPVPRDHTGTNDHRVDRIVGHFFLDARNACSRPARPAHTVTSPGTIPPAPPASPHVPRIVGTLYVIELVDGAHTPAQQALASSPTIQPALAKLNAYWYAWTTKSPEAARWLDDRDVKATGYPALLLVTANGAGNAVLSYITKLPDTEADVLAIVQAARTMGGK